MLRHGKINILRCFVCHIQRLKTGNCLPKSQMCARRNSPLTGMRPRGIYSISQDADMVPGSQLLQPSVKWHSPLGPFIQQLLDSPSMPSQIIADMALFRVSNPGSNLGLEFRGKTCYSKFPIWISRLVQQYLGQRCKRIKLVEFPFAFWSNGVCASNHFQAKICYHLYSIHLADMVYAGFRSANMSYC